MTATEEIDSSLFCKKIDNLFDDGEFDGWDLDVEFYGTRVYKRYDDVSSLCEYRVVGNLRNVRPDVCFQVYTDIIYRKKWDSYVKDLYKFEEGGDKAIYWEAKCPFPLSNRDYTYRCKTYELDENDRHVFIVHAHSFDSKLVPPKEGVTRVSEYKQVVVITADDVGGTILYMEYFENPGIKNPHWLVNWAAKNGIPDFLTVSEQACLGYERYLQAKN